MKTFSCTCGNTLYFRNYLCLCCNRAVGYLPDEKQFTALEPAASCNWQATFNGREYKQCKNTIDYNVCNWMVPVTDSSEYCESCRLNLIIPNLGDTQNLTLWYRVEKAKRRLLYSLHSLNLPVVSRDEDPERGLGFEFMQDETTYDEFTNEVTTEHSVATGHRAGIITINLLEAEHSSRLEMREKMHERYRTLLGHFRHESGHYYWERLINNPANIDSFRALFGDERNNYQASMKSYYANGPVANWQDSWVSAYASSHPWEDWAETWAHYLHIVDSLETANDYGFRIHGHDVSAPSVEGQMASGYRRPTSFGDIYDDWCRLSSALNALNRSLGQEDAYPFVIPNIALDKLRYIHQIVSSAANS